MSANFCKHLTSISCPIKSPHIYFESFPAIEQIIPSFYKCNPLLREELKAAIRKRSGIKGNIKSPFFQWRDLRIAFEVLIARFSTNDFMLLFFSEEICCPLTADEIREISYLPTQRQSQVRQSIEKLSIYLSTGDIRRKSAPIKRVAGYFPVISVFAFSPRNNRRSVVDDVPWHLIASIGTRHKDLQRDSSGLVRQYREKNFSIRDDICIINKQSLVSISDGKHLELEGIKFAAFIAYRTKLLLISKARCFTTIDPNIGPLIECLRYINDNPLVISDSTTFQSAWQNAYEGLRIPELLKSLERSLTEELAPPGALLQTVERIERIGENAGIAATDVRKLLELQKIDVRTAWNYVRRKLESILLSILDDVKINPNKKTVGALLDQVKKETSVPDDVVAAAELIRGFGNIGSHAAPTAYNPNKNTVTMVAHGLAHIIEWYTTIFRPSLFVKCANPRCGYTQRTGQKFCSECGTELPVDGKLKCPRCKQEVDASQKYCGRCGNSLSDDDSK